MEKSSIQKEKSTQGSVINATSSPLSSAVPCWGFAPGSLVWWPCPWHTLPFHNGVIVIPSTLKVETLSSGLSLNPTPLHFVSHSIALSCVCTPFPSLSLLYLFMVVQAGAHIHPKLFLSSSLIYPPPHHHPRLSYSSYSWILDHLLHGKHTLIHTHTLHYPTAGVCVSFFVRMIKQYPSFSPKQTTLFKMQRIQQHRY